MVPEVKVAITELDTQVATGNVRNPKHQVRFPSHFNHIKLSLEPLLFTGGQVSWAEEEILRLEVLQSKPQVLLMDGLQVEV
jgi:hypothetical protein